MENEKNAVIFTYKRQLNAFHHIKKEIEKIQWEDANYDALIEQMNAIGKELAKALQLITNGDDVYAISDVIPLATKYLQHAEKFPQI